MTYEFKDFMGLIESFNQSQQVLAGLKLEFPEGVNRLDPLTLLRSYQDKRTVEAAAELARTLFAGKSVRFMLDGECLHEFTYRSGDIGLYFAEAPYLLDYFFNGCYTLLLERLTPPSHIWKKEERKSPVEPEDLLPS